MVVSGLEFGVPGGGGRSRGGVRSEKLTGTVEAAARGTGAAASAPDVRKAFFLLRGGDDAGA